MQRVERTVYSAYPLNFEIWSDETNEKFYSCLCRCSLLLLALVVLRQSIQFLLLCIVSNPHFQSFYLLMMMIMLCVVCVCLHVCMCVCVCDASNINSHKLHDPWTDASMCARTRIVWTIVFSFSWNKIKTFNWAQEEQTKKLKRTSKSPLWMLDDGRWEVWPFVSPFNYVFSFARCLYCCVVFPSNFHVRFHLMCFKQCLCVCVWACGCVSDYDFVFRSVRYARTQTSTCETRTLIVLEDFGSSQFISIPLRFPIRSRAVYVYHQTMKTENYKYAQLIGCAHWACFTVYTCTPEQHEFHNYVLLAVRHEMRQWYDSDCTSTNHGDGQHPKILRFFPLSEIDKKVFQATTATTVATPFIGALF